jgi:hypothetical protein
MTPQEHNRLLSIFFHIQGGLQLFAGIVMVVMYVAFGSYFMLGMHDDGQFIGGLLIAIGIVTAVIVFLFAALDFYAGFKIGKVQKIGRTLGIVLGILSLFSFPVGTALGVYAIWFFFGDLGKALYNIDGAGSGHQYSPPPPPNSWQ